jgi:predicted nucleotidyltransferase
VVETPGKVGNESGAEKLGAEMGYWLLALIYLFGSAVRAKLKPDSDIDLAF